MTATTVTDVRIILTALIKDADEAMVVATLVQRYHAGRGDAYRTALALLEEVAS
tara:strand:- start:322 stop:483 length:162 start_codon:yes stop_codon:yes gene_type:complete